MHRVTYSMSTSLDGYIVGPDGSFDWSEPDPEVFRGFLDELRETGVHLMGRRLYETMLYWDDADPQTLDEQEQEWARLWRALPKVVFSTTLTAVEGAGTRLAGGGIAEEIERLRAEPGDGDIALGGATLAAEAARLGLIDEYRIRIHPILVGGGIPFLVYDERQVRLELVESRPYGPIVYVRYRVVRGDAA